MIQLLEGIAQILSDNGLGDLGNNIFIGLLPDNDPDIVYGGSAILLDATGGIEPDKDIPTAKPTVQVLVRNSNFQDGMIAAETIRDIFHTLHDGADFPNGVSIMRAYAINEPQHLDIDEKERHLFTCTFVFQYRKGL